jgi:predicted metalloenzyme YecM
MLDKIILPFVSKGATWMDDGCEHVDVEEVDDITMDDGEELTTTDVKTRVEEEKGGNDENMQDGDDYDTDNEEDEEDDEDDDLFLVLSPLFATDAYMSDNTADTFIFKFDGNDNGARLVRGGELREIGYNTHLNNDGDGHKNDVIAHEFVSKLRNQVPSFVSSIIMNLNSQYGMDVTNYQADHVCYRTATVYEYKRLVEALQADINNIRLLVESEIGGRSIATFKLAMPIEISNPCITTGDGGDSSSSTRRIDVIEIPSPKDGSPYTSGLEHVEFVIGNNRLLHNNNYSPVNDNHHQSH